MDERRNRIMELEKALVEKSTEALDQVQFGNEEYEGYYDETDAETWTVVREIIAMTIQLLQVTTSPNFAVENLDDAIRKAMGLLGGTE